MCLFSPGKQRSPVQPPNTGRWRPNPGRFCWRRNQGGFYIFSNGSVFILYLHLSSLKTMVSIKRWGLSSIYKNLHLTPWRYNCKYNFRLTKPIPVCSKPPRTLRYEFRGYPGVACLNRCWFKNNFTFVTYNYTSSQFQGSWVHLSPSSPRQGSWVHLWPMVPRPQVDPWPLTLWGWI